MHYIQFVKEYLAKHGMNIPIKDGMKNEKIKTEYKKAKQGGIIKNKLPKETPVKVAHQAHPIGDVKLFNPNPREKFAKPVDNADREYEELKRRVLVKPVDLPTRRNQQVSQQRLNDAGEDDGFMQPKREENENLKEARKSENIRIDYMGNRLAEMYDGDGPSDANLQWRNPPQSLLDANEQGAEDAKDRAEKAAKKYEKTAKITKQLLNFKRTTTPKEERKKPNRIVHINPTNTPTDNNKYTLDDDIFSLATQSMYSDSDSEDYSDDFESMDSDSDEDYADDFEPYVKPKREWKEQDTNLGKRKEEYTDEVMEVKERQQARRNEINRLGAHNDLVKQRIKSIENELRGLQRKQERNKQRTNDIRDRRYTNRNYEIAEVQDNIKKDTARLANLEEEYKQSKQREQSLERELQSLPKKFKPYTGKSDKMSKRESFDNAQKRMKDAMRRSKENRRRRGKYGDNNFAEPSTPNSKVEEAAIKIEKRNELLRAKEAHETIVNNRIRVIEDELEEIQERFKRRLAEEQHELNESSKRQKQRQKEATGELLSGKKRKPEKQSGYEQKQQRTDNELSGHYVQERQGTKRKPDKQSGYEQKQQRADKFALADIIAARLSKIIQTGERGAEHQARLNAALNDLNAIEDMKHKKQNATRLRSVLTNEYGNKLSIRLHKGNYVVGTGLKKK